MSLLLVILFVMTLAQPITASAIAVTGFMDSRDFVFCYEAMQIADTNHNGQLDAQEYVQFAQLTSPPGLLDGVTSFAQLPLGYQAAFFGVACLCNVPAYGGNASDVNCCYGPNAVIRIPAQPPGQETLQQQAYLYAACSRTRAAASTVVVPTASPTMHPSSRFTYAPTTTLLPPSTLAPTTPQPVMTTLSPTIVRTVPPTPQGSAPPAPTTAQPSTQHPTLTSTFSVTTTPPHQNGSSPPSLANSISPVVSSFSASPSSPPITQPGRPTTPTIAPSSSPSFSLTSSQSPTVRPTTPMPGSVPTQTASVSYDIAVDQSSSHSNRTSSNNNNNAFVVAYLSDLIVAMNRLAPQVATNVFGRRRRLRTLRHKRHLQQQAATVQVPTRLGNIDTISTCVCVTLFRGYLSTFFVPLVHSHDVLCSLPRYEYNTACPSAIASSNIICQDVQAMVTLLLVSTTNGTTNIVTDFETALNTAIAQGRLQQELLAVNPNTPVTILNGSDGSNLSPTTSPGSNSGSGTAGNNTLSSGATAGVVVGAVALVLLPALFYYATRKRSSDEEREEKQEFTPYKEQDEAHRRRPLDDDSEFDPEDAASRDQSPHDNSNISNIEIADSLGDADVYMSHSDDNLVMMSPGTLGATQPDYGRKSRRQQQIHPLRDDEDDDEDFSAAPTAQQKLMKPSSLRSDDEDDQAFGDSKMDKSSQVMAPAPRSGSPNEPDNSSHAGSSGWSSSAGISSYNTGSVQTGSLDGSSYTDPTARAAATLAGLGVASSLVAKKAEEKEV